MKNLPLIACLWFCSVSYAQIPNAGFESWHVFETDTMPDDWYISPFGAAQTDDAFVGDNAIVVWNWYYYALGKACLSANNTAALLIPNDFISDYGVPLSTRPLSLKGYYKYIYGNSDGEADSAVVTISLRKYNSETGMKDSIGFAIIKLPPVDVYTPFTLPVGYYSELIPDTVVIALYSSSPGSMCSPESDGNCLYFYVDELAFETPLGLISVEEATHSNAYPVPANNILHLDMHDEVIQFLRLYDITGKSFTPSWVTSGDELLLNIADLAQGMYFYEMRNEREAVYAGRFVKK